jgi:phosphoglycolate phosphatase
MGHDSNPYSLAIFDLDGTLADSFPWFLKVVNEVAREFDFRPVAAADVAALRRASTSEILTRLDLPLWKVPRIATRMRALKREHLDAIPLFPGIPDMLETLRAHGTMIALVTSDSDANARRQLGDSAGCFLSFDCGASLFGKAAKFRRVVRRFGLPPSAAIAIGDEVRDMDAADAAGIAFGGVAWGYADPDALRARHPQAWFDSVADIPRLLATSGPVR